MNGRTGTKERMGSVLEVQGKEHHPFRSSARANRRRAEARTSWPATCADAERSMIVPGRAAARADRLGRGRAEGARRGREDGEALRRLSEEDPTLRISRDERTERAARERALPDARRGDGRAREAPLRRRHRHAPAARAVLRGDPQEDAGARALQEADRRPRPVRRLPHRDRAAARRTRATSSSTRSSAASSRRASGPPSTRASRRRCTPAMLAGLPRDRRARHAGRRLVPQGRLLRDGVQDRGSMAFKKAYSEADAVLLEPIMAVEITSPADSVGDVIGDLNSRRGRPLGMDPRRCEHDDPAPRCRCPRCSPTLPT